MKAKRILGLLLVGAMAVSAGALAACKKTGDSGNNGGNGGNGGGGANYTIDETEYYLVGTGDGTLSTIPAWTNSDHTLAFERDENADHNVFNITIDMYADDAFKIVYEDSWDNQYNITHITGYSDDDGGVKNDDGDIVFAKNNDQNILLAAGQDGKYTFSLHTYPDGEKDAYVSYTKDEALEPLPPKMDMYIAWDTNDFNDMQSKQEESHMTQNGSIWTYSLEVTEKDLCRDVEGELVDDGAEYVAVAVINSVDGTVICDSTRTPEPVFINGDEYNLLGVGSYTLRYNSDKQELTIVEGEYVEVVDYYLVGTFLDDAGNQHGFGVDEVSPKFVLGDDGLYTAEVVVTDVTGSYTWLTSETTGGIFACKVVSYTETNGIDWNAANNSGITATDYVKFEGGNIVFTTAGTYVFTLDAATGAVSIAPKA